MKKIDAHAHIGYYGSFFDVGTTAEEYISLMDEYDFEKALIMHLDNEEVRKATEVFPDRLYGAVWVNPHDGQDAVDQVKRAMDDWGFLAVKIHPLIHAFIANDSIVHPIARLADEFNIPIFIHSGHPPFSLPWSIAQLAEEFPRLKIVMVHMGHGHGVYIQAAIDMAKKFSNLYLETSGMPMHTKIKEAYEQVGSGRILFGTDVPFHHPSVEIQRSMVSGLNESQLKDLFYNNAEVLLGFKKE